MGAGRRPRAEPAAVAGGAVIDTVVACYLAVLLLAAVQAIVLGGSGTTLRGAVVYLAALVVYVGVRARRRRGGDDALLVGLALGGAALAAWIVAAFVLALPAGVGDPSGFYRVKGAITTPLGDHNTAAGLLLPCIAAAAVMSVRDRRWLTALGVCALGLVGTLSRGAALTLLLVAVGSVVVPKVVPGVGRLPTGAVRTATVAAAALAAVLAVAGVLGAAPPPGAALGAAPNARGPLGASVVGRVDLIVRGVEVGVEHPGLGVGLRRFGEYAQDLPPPNHHAHNLLTHAVAEGGLVLLVVAGALPVVLLLRVRRRPRDRVRDAFAIGATALVLHAQHDILGGLLGYEVMLAVALAACATPTDPVSGSDVATSP